MKTIRYGLIGCILLISTNAQAGSCQVTYKAKKVKTEKFLFRTIENLVFKSGKIKSEGKSKKACKESARKTLLKTGWTMTYSSVTMS